VVHERDRGLVFEVAFEGLQRSSRHRSGIAMRFPRISRLRFDKAPRDADRLERLEAVLARRSESSVSREGTEAGAPGPSIGAGNASTP
jgi:DNA ligase-1